MCSVHWKIFSKHQGECIKIKIKINCKLYTYDWNYTIYMCYSPFILPTIPVCRVCLCFVNASWGRSWYVKCCPKVGLKSSLGGDCEGHNTWFTCISVNLHEENSHQDWNVSSQEKCDHSEWTEQIHSPRIRRITVQHDRFTVRVRHLSFILIHPNIVNISSKSISNWQKHLQQS